RCATGGVARLAALRDWRRCATGGVARLAALRDWRRCATGGVARLAALLDWRRCATGGAARLAPQQLAQAVPARAGGVLHARRLQRRGREGLAREDRGRR